MTLYTSTIAPYGAPKQAETKPFRGALTCERTGVRAEVLRHTIEKISRDGHAKGGELAPPPSGCRPKPAQTKARCRDRQFQREKQEDGARLGNYPMYYYLTRFLGRQPKKGVVLS